MTMYLFLFLPDDSIRLLFKYPVLYLTYKTQHLASYANLYVTLTRKKTTSY